MYRIFVHICIQDRDKDDGYASCQLLRFTSSILQETTYEMLVEDARTKLHKKAANFLEDEVSTCEVFPRSFR